MAAKEQTNGHGGGSSSGAGGGKVAKRTLTTFTPGRPPWFDVTGEVKEAFIIGVAGGSASGKTTVAKYTWPLPRFAAHTGSR